MIEIPTWVAAVVVVLAAMAGYFAGAVGAMRSKSLASGEDVVEAGGRIEARLDIIEEMVQGLILVPEQDQMPDRMDPMGQMGRERWFRYMHDTYHGLKSGQKR
jgi:hypothetical protein